MESKKLFSGMQNLAQAVGNTVNRAQAAANAFGGQDPSQMGYINMMGNPSVSRGNDSILGNEDEEDSPNQVEYQAPIDLEISDRTIENFRRKATMKTDILILSLQQDYLMKKVAAKILIQNTGDDIIAQRNKDKTFNEIQELPKDIQNIIRNQKHLKAIDENKIEEYFKEQCIEYFMQEFEDDYRNGIQPNFTGINPVEYLKLQMSAPFNKLIGDVVVDYALEAKPKMQLAYKTLLQKYFSSPTKVEEQPEEQIIETAEVVDTTQEHINPEEGKIIKFNEVVALNPDENDEILRNWSHKAHALGHVVNAEENIDDWWDKEHKSDEEDKPLDNNAENE